MNTVSILLANDLDKDLVKSTIKIFEKFNVYFELVVLDESEKKAKEFFVNSEDKGTQIFICTASVLKRFSNTLSNSTIKPIIALIDETKELDFISQMPIGMPITNIFGKEASFNAAYLAIEILALSDKNLRVKLKEDRIIKNKNAENKLNHL